MPSGYLRILFPAPTECLDLKAWQNFHGFDKNGAIGDFDIEIDTDRFVMTVKPSSGDPFPFRRMDSSKRCKVDELPKLFADEKTPTDFFGNDVSGVERIAGPIADLPLGVEINIDPRKL